MPYIFGRTAQHYCCLCACRVCTRVALIGISVHDNIRYCRHDLLDQPICEHGHPLMIVLLARAQTQTPRVRMLLILEQTFVFCFIFLPPSPAGRCCKQLPGQQPGGWGQFQNVTPSPAHLRSAAAPNEPGADGAHTERLPLHTHASAGQQEAAVQTSCFQMTV